MEERVVKSLGFDAESPMVRIEVSRILSLGQGATADGEAAALPPNVFGGYTEEIVAFDEQPTVATVSPVQFREMANQQPDSPGIGSTFRIAWIVAVALVLLILTGGILILLQARRRVS